MRVRLVAPPVASWLSALGASLVMAACASAESTSDDDPGFQAEAGGSEGTEGGAAGESGEGGEGGSAGTTGIAGEGGSSGKGGVAGGPGGGKGGSAGAAAGQGGGGAGPGPGGAAGTSGASGTGGKSGAGGAAGAAGSSAGGAGGTGSCGDGKKAPTEQCDGKDFGGGTCASLLGNPDLSGTLVCTGNCQVDTTGCVTNPKCGDGKKNVAAEECDGNDFAGKSCADVLADPKASGALGCDAQTCKIISTGCQKGPFCGNGSKDDGEACDGSDVGKDTCASATGDPNKTGALLCAADCKLDTTKCVIGAKCGDSTKNGDNEQCDGPDLNGATCKSALGNTNATGTLKCAADCQLDKTGCTVPLICGDGARNVAAEECDGQDFGTDTCETKLGKGHAGSLLCSMDCKIGTGACMVVPYCGDTKIDAGEQCDGATLGADATCEKIVGFMSAGTVTCAPNCTYDTAACSKPVTCGNSALDPGEECDAALLGGKTCADALGNPNAIGTLACAAACTFDKADCSIGPYCGDGKLGAGEECDAGPGNGGARCSATCKAKCDSIESKLGTHCYVDSDFYFDDMTYDQATAFCATVPNGHLVTISSKAELEFVFYNVMPGDPFTTAARWIGLNDKSTEGTFVWLTGEPVGYTNWNGGEPNNAGNAEDCTEMSWNNGSWNDNNCSKTHTFICEVEPAVQFP